MTQNANEATNSRSFHSSQFSPLVFIPQWRIDGFEKITFFESIKSQIQNLISFATYPIKICNKLWGSMDMTHFLSGQKWNHFFSRAEQYAHVENNSYLDPHLDNLGCIALVKNVIGIWDRLVESKLFKKV